MKNKRYMKKWAERAVFLLTAGMMLAGCQKSDQGNIRELRIREETSRMEEWQEKLEQDDGQETLTANAIRGLNVVKDGETVFEVSYEPKTYKEAFDFWNIAVPYESMVSVDTESLYDLFETVAQLPCIPVSGISSEEAGIEGSQTSLFIAYNGEQREGEKGGADPTKARKILVGNQDENGNYYVEIEGNDSICQVNQLWLDTILELDPYQYILKIPFLAGIDTVEQVKVSIGDDTLLLQKTEDTCKIGKEKVERSEYNAFYNQLLSVLVSGEVGKKGVDPGQRKPVLTMQFYRNTEDASDVEVTYFEYNEEYMSINVNGKEFFLAERQDVENLQQLIKEHL